MELRDFAEYVAQMRADQKAYFAHRTSTNLAASMASERMIDRMLKQIVPATPEPVLAQAALPLATAPEPVLRAD